jgi:hypothetical protein
LHESLLPQFWYQGRCQLCGRRGKSVRCHVRDDGVVACRECAAHDSLFHNLRTWLDEAVWSPHRYPWPRINTVVRVWSAMRKDRSLRKKGEA